MNYIQNYLHKISVIILFLFAPLLAETPDFIWAKQFGSTGNEYARKIARDRSGNFFIAGEYHDSFTFGTTKLKGKEFGNNIFLAKMNSSGDILWVKDIISSGSVFFLKDISCDPFGNCFILGKTESQTYIDKDSLVTGTSCWGAFLIKIGGSGNYEWGVLGTSGEILGVTACATDENGNCFVVGYDGGFYFPQIGVGEWEGLCPCLFKISKDGVALWGKAGPLWYSPIEIATDGYGNCYLATSYFGDKIIKYSPSGDSLWCKEVSLGIRSLACDAVGNLVLTSSFGGTVTFGSTTLTSKGKDDMCVAKLDSKGDPLWARSGGGIGTDKGLGVSMTGSGNVFVTGYMANSATFDQITLSNPQGTDLFVVCYDKDGNLLWAKNTSGTGETAGESVVSDGQGYCAITGAIERTIDFDANPFTSKGQKDIFVARLGVVPQEVTVNYEFKTPGWYLVSLPVTPANKSVSALFPTAVNAYRYDAASRSYQAVSMMDPQNGYWLLFNKASSAAISGLPITGFTQSYPAGWHLIGTVAGTTNFSNPADVPDGAVLAVLGWQTVGEQYVPIYPTGAQKLEEKQGYWLAALQDFQLSLPSESGFAKNNAVSPENYDNFVQNFGPEPPPPPFLTGVSDGLLRPVQELTSRHFPNPFNPIITIEYYLPENGETAIRIYNNLGQMVRELVRDYQNAGKHQIVWDARNEAGEEVANGIYLYQIIQGGNSINRKMMLLR